MTSSVEMDRAVTENSSVSRESRHVGDDFARRWWSAEMYVVNIW
ncbi:hypothetical protein AAFP35_21205 [Gordonia sp. CPCC 206044]